MKPLKLTMSAFGAYAEKEEIDMKKLGENGIYLITGNTGAGKTTIFDALTYALYGETSGEVREPKMLRSKYAEEKTETYVELEFTYAEKNYKIKRNPEYEKESKRAKSGISTKSSKAELTMPDGKVITKIAEVNGKIKEILGINQEQFKQICMIAQGDFLKLLLAETKERQKIFQNIFKTEYYERFQEELKIKAKNKDEECKDAKKDITKNIEKIDFGTNFANEENIEKINRNKEFLEEDFVEFLEKLVENQKKKDVEYSKKLDEIKKIQDEILLKKNELENIKNKNIEINKNKEEYKLKEIEASEIEKICEKHSEKTEQIEKLKEEKNDIKNDYEKYEKLQNIFDRKNVEEQKLQEQNAEKEKIENELEIKKSDLEIKKNEKENKKNAREKFAKLHEEKIRIEIELKKYNSLNQLFENYEKADENLQNIIEKIEENEKKLSKITEEKGKIEAELKQKNEKILSFENIEENEKKLQTEKITKENELEKIKSLQKMYVEIEKIGKEYELELEKYKESSNISEIQREKANILRKQYNDNQAGILASTLKDGEECPVCGSKSHPKLAVISEEKNISLEDVENEEKIAEKLSKKTSELSQKCGEIKGKLDEKERSFNQIFEEILEKESKQKKALNEEKTLEDAKKLNENGKNEKNESRLNWINSKISVIENELSENEKKIVIEENRKFEREKCKKEIEIENAKIVQNERETVKITEEKNELDIKKAVIQREISIIEKDIKKGFSEDSEFKVNFGENFKENLKFEKEKIVEKLDILSEKMFENEKNTEIEKENNETFEKLEKIIPNIESEVVSDEKKLIQLAEKLKNVNMEIEKLETEYQQMLKSLKFKNKKEAEDKILEIENEILEIDKNMKIEKEKASKLKDEIIVLKTKMGELTKEIEKKEKIDEDELLENEKNIKLEAETITEQKRKNDNMLSSNEKSIAEIKGNYEKLLKLEKESAMLKNLSKTASGDLEGKARIALETYVQMRYFDRIVWRANARFKRMSNGQYELKREEEAKKLNTKTGLNLEVIDYYNGTVRSVKTLSGGESFMASLCLALGLSDEIQSAAGGIKLDTMFIDEGFGTLDEETLDKAISTLIELSNEKKLIGIISHVGELKSRIDKQIVINKDKNGVSHAKILE